MPDPSANPLQPDGESLDLTVKDWDGLERMHKQDAWTLDQERHFQYGWEAAMTFYRDQLTPRTTTRTPAARQRRTGLA